MTSPALAAFKLGSGGGHNAVHLKASFAMTLTDLSEEMLEVSRQLNPECEHRQGDMRTLRLGRTFDALLVHDAVDYMTNEADLRRAIDTAFVHCRPGAVAVFIPDSVMETFEASSDHGGTDGPDGRGVRYLEWTWDPDPNDAWTVSEYAFLLRDREGSVNLVHEQHCTGLFSRGLWLRLLADAGFDPASFTEDTTEERTPRDVFAGRRPLA